jgi:hypothetical protein
VRTNFITNTSIKARIESEVCKEWEWICIHFGLNGCWVHWTIRHDYLLTLDHDNNNFVYSFLWCLRVEDDGLRDGAPRTFFRWRIMCEYRTTKPANIRGKRGKVITIKPVLTMKCTWLHYRAANLGRKYTGWHRTGIAAQWRQMASCDIPNTFHFQPQEDTKRKTACTYHHRMRNNR